jgi:transcriptional regulator with XRE-family HTH domain
MAHRPINTLAIKLARRKAGITQEVLGNRIRVARNTISRVEMGHGGDDLLLAISQELNAPLESFYLPMPGRDGQLSEEEQELVARFRDLNEMGRVMAMTAVRTLAMSRENRRTSPAPCVVSG